MPFIYDPSEYGLSRIQRRKARILLLAAVLTGQRRPDFLDWKARFPGLEGPIPWTGRPDSLDWKARFPGLVALVSDLRGFCGGG
jgi:hypothetical protein